ncbi:MAG TPA: response regulator, partial [Chloroflexota bacterium]|nr:response regulator [Chloroflexota bacterium]
GLIGAGYVVRRAESASEALLMLERRRADLILMSLMLPDADGLMLCATLKTQFWSPIIVLTGRTGTVDRALALESGALDVLNTPVDVDALLALVQAAVQTPVSAIRSD